MGAASVQARDALTPSQGCASLERLLPRSLALCLCPRGADSAGEETGWLPGPNWRGPCLCAHLPKGPFRCKSPLSHPHPLLIHHGQDSPFLLPQTRTPGAAGP